MSQDLLNKYETRKIQLANEDQNIYLLINKFFNIVYIESFTQLSSLYNIIIQHPVKFKQKQRTKHDIPNVFLLSYFLVLVGRLSLLIKEDHSVFWRFMDHRLWAEIHFICFWISLVIEYLPTVNVKTRPSTTNTMKHLEAF